MDLDWCTFCEKRSHFGQLYCSEWCRQQDDTSKNLKNLLQLPNDLVYHYNKGHLVETSGSHWNSRECGVKKSINGSSKGAAKKWEQAFLGFKEPPNPEHHHHHHHSNNLKARRNCSENSSSKGIPKSKSMDHFFHYSYGPILRISTNAPAPNPLHNNTHKFKQQNTVTSAALADPCEGIQRSCSKSNLAESNYSINNFHNGREPCYR